MLIVINTISARRGGGQTYLVNLLGRLDLLPESFKIVILGHTLSATPKDQRITHVSPPKLVSNPFFRALWERCYLPILLKRLKTDIYFCPGGVVSTPSSRNWKTVVMFRNMIPFSFYARKMYPFGYARLRNWLLERIMLTSMLNSDLVIFISNYAKEIIESQVAPKRIESVTIPHGLSNIFKTASQVDLKRPEWLPENKYLLYVSLFEVYKNHITVVRGYHLLKTKYNIKEKLILVGNETLPSANKVRREIRELMLEKDIFILGNVDYRELPAIYHHASVNIFASECENCPNILLEALGAGRPTVVANCQPMPEFAEDAAVYFNPSSPEDFAKKVDYVLKDKDARETYSERAEIQSGKYSWESTVKLTWEALGNIHS